MAGSLNTDKSWKYNAQEFWENNQSLVSILFLSYVLSIGADRRQDEELDELSLSVQRIGGVGLTIHEELLAQVDLTFDKFLVCDLTILLSGRALLLSCELDVTGSNPGNSLSPCGVKAAYFYYYSCFKSMKLGKNWWCLCFL